MTRRSNTGFFFVNRRSDTTYETFYLPLSMWVAKCRSLNIYWRGGWGVYVCVRAYVCASDKDGVAEHFSLLEEAHLPSKQKESPVEAHSPSCLFDSLLPRYSFPSHTYEMFEHDFPYFLRIPIFH